MHALPDVRRALTLIVLLVAPTAAAQSAATTAAPTAAAPAAPEAAVPADPHAAPVAGSQVDPHAAPPDPTVQVSPAKDPARKATLEPKPSESVPRGRVTFDIDPVADSSMIAVSLGFAGVLELINSTGEIRPQQISPTFEQSQLLSIDRGVLNRSPDPHAPMWSTVGLGVAVGYAVLDPILSGYREKSLQTGLADAFMYAESVSFTFALTDVVKMAVRRPRPIAYINHKNDPNYQNSTTDSALSFFSGHAAITATLGATATYLAFARSPQTARPWLTLVAAVGLTTFVSYERVRAGVHFPTDVIAGSIVGAGVGVAVPHLHRTDDIKQRRVWVGFAPLNELRGEHGGMLTASGIF